MSYRPYGNPFAQHLSPAVRILIIVNVAVFAIQVIVDAITRTSPHGVAVFSDIFGLSLSRVTDGFVWQPFTYMFLHANNPWHILMNMLALYMLGCETERDIGTKRFLRLYLGAGLAGGLGWILLCLVTGNNGNCVGASGAIFGIIGAFAALRPNQMLTLLVFFVIPITLSARVLAIILGFISLFYTINMDGNVAHVAHLAGGLAGYFYARKLTTEFMPGFPPSVEKEARTKHASRVRKTLRLVVNRDMDPPSPEEVDHILDKINATGMDSLTQGERKTLERASGVKK
jgi:membrane associated rhomboid family serine protease